MERLIYFAIGDERVNTHKSVQTPLSAHDKNQSVFSFAHEYNKKVLIIPPPH